jgi:Double-stranded RNA binding motif.
LRSRVQTLKGYLRSPPSFKGKRLGVGIAPSKKEAEEKAAKKAFDYFKNL